MIHYFYAIKVGKDVEDIIVNSWEECKKYVIGYPSIYKKFDSIKKANHYLKNMTDDMVDYYLKWNEIHREFRLRKYKL